MVSRRREGPLAGVLRQEGPNPLQRPFGLDVRGQLFVDLIGVLDHVVGVPEADLEELASTSRGRSWCIRPS
jgi:hypothetical protein